MSNNSNGSNPEAPPVPQVQLKPPHPLSGDFQAPPTPELSSRAAEVPNPPPSLSQIAPPKPTLEARLDASGFWVVAERSFRAAGYVDPDSGRAWGASFRGALRRGLSPDAAALEADLSWLEPALTELDRSMPAWHARHMQWLSCTSPPEAKDRADRDFGLLRAGLALTHVHSAAPMRQLTVPGAGLELGLADTERAGSSALPAVAALAAADPVVRSGLEGPKRRGRPPGSKSKPKAPERSGPGSVPAFVPIEADRRARDLDVPTDGEGGPGIVGEGLARAALEGIGNALPPAARAAYRQAAELEEDEAPALSTAERQGIRFGGPGSGGLRPKGSDPLPLNGPGGRDLTLDLVRRLGLGVAELLEPLPPWRRRHALTIAAAHLGAIDTDRRIVNELAGRPLEAPHPPHPGARHPLRLAEASAELRDRLRETLEAFDGLTLEREGAGE